MFVREKSVRYFFASLFVFVLSSCQFNEFFYQDKSSESVVGPSSHPQIVEKLRDKNSRIRLDIEQHFRIVSGYGGEYHNKKVELLLARIVGALTRVSGSSKHLYRVIILNSSSVNAFALPGGNLYVTRGLLALCNDASEVAAVLAHEMAHIILNHGVERQQEQQKSFNQLAMSDMVPSDITEKQMFAQKKLQLAAFSRNQELQADATSVRMLSKAGYDPYAAVRFLSLMSEYNKFALIYADSKQNFNFLANHPSTPQRIQLIRLAAANFSVDENVGERGRDYYLLGIDGLLYSDVPENGFLLGQTFFNKTLGISFDIPFGFQGGTKSEVLLAVSHDGVTIRFDTIDNFNNMSLINYIKSGWVKGINLETIKSVKINDLDAITSKAFVDRWSFDVTIISYQRYILRLITAVPKDSNALEATTEVLRNSFHRMSSNEINKLKPLYVRILQVQPNDSIEKLAKKIQGTDRSIEFFKIINEIKDNAVFRSKGLIKVISE